jgi:hypothetical protein
VRDQCLVLRQFQGEFVAQERRQALFDLFGFGLGSGEPEQGVVALCRVPDYADRDGDALVRELTGRDRSA